MKSARVKLKKNQFPNLFPQEFSIYNSLLQKAFFSQRKIYYFNTTTIQLINLSKTHRKSLQTKKVKQINQKIQFSEESIYKFPEARKQYYKKLYAAV